MCGITGFIDFKNRTEEMVLKKMTDSLSHRGPDGDGMYINRTRETFIGLGHRRLSVIDLSNAASQPMQYDGLHIVFNGEIYNYEEIQKYIN